MLKLITVITVIFSLVALPVMAATTDFVAGLDITISGVTFGATTTDITVLSGSSAESINFNGGTFTITNPDSTAGFTVSCSDSNVKSIAVKDSGDTTVACVKNSTPGISFVSLPTDTDSYTIEPGSIDLSYSVTYNSSCGAATCQTGFEISGSGASATCFSPSAGGIIGYSVPTTTQYQIYDPITGEITIIDGSTAEDDLEGNEWSSSALVQATIAKERGMVHRINNQLRNRLKGSILLQVEENGEGWYVNPADQKKYYLGRPKEAYEIMRFLSIGITNSDLNRLMNDIQFAFKHVGKIFIQVQEHGEAYYVDSEGGVTYMKDGGAAYDIMRGKGLGITNNDIRQIPVGETLGE